MDLDVLLFAGLREAIGRERVRVELEDGARVRDLVARLASLHPAIGPRARFAVAVNREIAGQDRALAPGDEVALLPPVGGGATDDELVELTDRAIDASRLLAFVGDPGAGGVTLFLGTARDHHDGRAVERLEYEAYAAMAEKTLRDIARETRAAVPALKRIAIVHRLGLVPIGEASVAVAASAPHRDESFRACRHAIDELKARAPIWKKERLKDGGAVWVANKEPGPR